MFSMGGMRNSFLCSAISSDSFPFFLLSHCQNSWKRRLFSLPSFRYCAFTPFHSVWNQPATPAIQLKSLSLKHHQWSATAKSKFGLSPRSSWTTLQPDTPSSHPKQSECSAVPASDCTLHRICQAWVWPQSKAQFPYLWNGANKAYYLCLAHTRSAS